MLKNKGNDSHFFTKGQEKLPSNGGNKVSRGQLKKDCGKWVLIFGVKRRWPGRFRKYDSAVQCVRRPTKGPVPLNIRHGWLAPRYQNHLPDWLL